MTTIQYVLSRLTDASRLSAIDSSGITDRIKTLVLETWDEIDPALKSKLLLKFFYQYINNYSEYAFKKSLEFNTRRSIDDVYAARQTYLGYVDKYRQLYPSSGLNCKLLEIQQKIELIALSSASMSKVYSELSQAGYSSWSDSLLSMLADYPILIDNPKSLASAVDEIIAPRSAVGDIVRCTETDKFTVFSYASDFDSLIKIYAYFTTDDVSSLESDDDLKESIRTFLSSPNHAFAEVCKDSFSNSQFYNSLCNLVTDVPVMEIFSNLAYLEYSSFPFWLASNICLKSLYDAESAQSCLAVLDSLTCDFTLARAELEFLTLSTLNL